MAPRDLKLFETEGPLCSSCPWRDYCGAMYGDEACRSKWKARSSGGGQILHPSFPVTGEFLASVGGPSFLDIAVHPATVPDLPRSITQIRIRRELQGQLSASAYAITAGQIIGKRDRPMTAAEVREMVGLGRDQLLLLLLFGRDEYLEHLWNQRSVFLPELASAGFDLIVAPSYSAWEPRPRPEFFYAAKRSLVVFGALQDLGANAVPRVTWKLPYDVERWVAWKARNPALECVGLDLTTYKGDRGFEEQLELLSTFDDRTGGEFTYIVNGPSTFDRIRRLFEAVAPDRVHVTNSRAIARAAAPGARFTDKVETETLIVKSAARACLADPAKRSISLRDNVASQ
jgi:hypothetical protein